MKFNTPIPQVLPKECVKAARIISSFVDDGKNGLDGIIPRHVLENAHGFAFLSVVKAGFLLSARAGSGLVIARLEDGTWSAPSAIGTAGMGFGGQAGAEITDYLIVLNTKSAVRSFMSAGSFTLGGNLSIAAGPVGRTGEANFAVNSKGKTTAMYSYSKTKGLFGGVSIEGSVIVERQDANAIAYEADHTAQMLLSGVVPPPQWSDGLIKTIEHVTGSAMGRKWVRDASQYTPTEYAFGGMGSPGSSTKKAKKETPQFPPANWGTPKGNGSYFDGFEDYSSSTTATAARTPDKQAPGPERDLLDFDTPPMESAASADLRRSKTTGGFGTRLTSPFEGPIKISGDKMTSPFDTSALKGSLPTTPGGRPKMYRSSSAASDGMKARAAKLSNQLADDIDLVARLARGNSKPPSPAIRPDDYQPFDDRHLDHDPVVINGTSIQQVSVNFDKSSLDFPSAAATAAAHQRPSNLRKATSYSISSSEDELDKGGLSSGTDLGRAPSQRFNAALKAPLEPGSVGRALARFDFQAAEAGDLSLHKGDIVTILEKSNSTEDWWKGRVGLREGMFPANFVEVVQTKH